MRRQIIRPYKLTTILTKRSIILSTNKNIYNWHRNNYNNNNIYIEEFKKLLKKQLHKVWRYSVTLSLEDKLRDFLKR